MSTSKAKTTISTIMLDAQIEYIMSFDDNFLKSQVARNMCYGIENSLTWTLKQIADLVAELDELVEEQLKGVERMKALTIEKNLDRAKAQETELRAALAVAIEAHAAFKLPSQAVYKAKV